MRELSLHILDLVQNSIEAHATQVALTIIENSKENLLSIRICDNGKGMDKELLKQVFDPFVTTRTTRRVGLGLPLFQMSAKRCGGYLEIESEPGVGTKVEAVYQYHHIDRPPLGQLCDTIRLIMITNPELDFCYTHVVESVFFSISTKEITAILGDIPLSHPDVIIWLTNFLTDKFTNLYGGVCDENH